MTQLNPFCEYDGIVVYHGDCRDVIPKLKLNARMGWIVDPPWDTDIMISPGIRKLVFCDGSRQRDVIAKYGPPLWIFVWDCVTSWFTKGRPLRRAKFAFWYGTIAEYVFDGAHYGNPCGEPRVVTNSRGSYRFEPSKKGKHLSDIYKHPITSLHKSGPSHEKPLEWIRMLIANCLSMCDVIIDPFAGSGVTGRAAMDLGKKAVLIEKEIKLCEVIMARLSQRVLTR